ncbi:MAG: flagellar filament capping protein FliD [Hydrogenophilaceae bacterium]|nr:flagellar filament capping protein FliD [Hydrogenophilaceae bacterium]
MANISASGVGSGLDINNIISQLMAVERQPLNQLDTQQKKYESQLSAYGQLKSALSTFQSSVNTLSSLDKFRVYGTNSTDETVFTATASSSAAPASYQIEVTQLAQQHKISASSVSATTDVIGTGTLTIEFGTHDTGGGTFTPNADKTPLVLTIDSSNNTLSGIRDAINKANAGVSASIIYDGSGYRLIVSSNESGAANSLKITTADDDGSNTDTSGLSLLAYDPLSTSGAGKNMSQLSEARNALFSIDGIAITHDSNSISNVIEGVTLNLKKLNTGTPATLTVSRDIEAVSTAVQDFVKAYNDVDKVLKDLTAYNDQTKKGAVLQGDSVTRHIRNQLRGIMTGTLDNNAFTTLSQAGVSFQRDGTLAVDASRLEDALNDNFEAVGNLFARDSNIASETGFGFRLDDYLDDLLDTNGSLAIRTDGISYSIRSLERTEERMEARMVQIEARYRAQFTALDSLISSLNSTSAFLTQQLKSLNASNDS